MIKKNVNSLMLINIIFATSLIISNVLAGKLIMLFNWAVLPAAVVAYAITFLCTDIVDEIWGKEEAHRTVKYGFIAQIFACFLILMGKYLPVAPFAIETQKAYEVLLGQNWRIVIASLTAYVVSQNLDVIIFNRIGVLTKGNKKWIRNNVSTITSQLIDTSIFITIAFAGRVPNIVMMIIAQYLIKVILALADTPIFYLLTKKEHNRFILKESKK